MKYKIFFLLLVALSVATSGFAQKVSLAFQKVPLDGVLAEITKQTKVTFAYSQPVIDPKTEVSINVKNVELRQALDDLLASTDIAYEISDKKVLLFSKSQSPGNTNSTGENNVVVTGIVTDAMGALAGALVRVKGTNKVVVTDANGYFSLEADAQDVLEVSFMGYSMKEISMAGRTQLEVFLEEDARVLDEVVMVGYGVQRKRDLTGSIASIQGDELPKTANTTLGQMLKGQVPGLSFTQTSSQPGAAVWMQIRGAAAGASPLIVIDGVPVSTMWEPDTGLNYQKGDKESILDNINPDDVQDIQVLKDASATSIYGSRAAGGVILITTKRGTEGRRTQVSFKTSYTTQWIAKKPEVMSAQDYMRESNKSQLEQWVREQGYYPWGTTPLPSYDVLVQQYENAYSGVASRGWNYDPAAIDGFQGGTDWYKEISRQGGIQQYDLSVVGGSHNTAYLISGSHMTNNGVLKNNNYARTTGRVNLDHTFNKWIKAGISANYSYVNSDDAALSGRDHGVIPIYEAARSFDPVVPIRDINGNYTVSEIRGEALNPVSILDVSLLTKKDNFLTSAYLDIKPIEDLIIKTTVGYDRKFASSESYFPSTTREGRDYEGIARIVKHELSNYYINVTATYNKIFAEDHSVSVMAGWEYQMENTSGVNAENRGFPYDGVLWYNLGLGTYEKPIVGSFSTRNENASFMARLNYAYKGKYLLTANFRSDGSSNFAANKQWGNFGGVSMAWRINDEAFLRNASWVSNLKLRVGAGITGYAGSLTGTTTYYTATGWNYYFNNQLSSGMGLSVLGNPNLSWESQQDINIGLDFGFFNNKLGGSLDVYERTITNRIGEKQLMSYQQVNTIHYNTERIDKTRGVDVSLYGTLVNNKSFAWHSQFTLTYYRDLTTKRDPSEVLDIYESEKYTWNDMWYYASDGLVQPNENIPHMPNALAGSVKIKDINGFLRDEFGNKVFDENGRPIYLGSADGQIDAADLVKIGNNTPILFSWNNTFTYKNFDLNIGIYGKLHNYKGNDKIGNVDYTAPGRGANTGILFKDRYTFDNLTSAIPSFAVYETGLWIGDYLMEDAWFIRVDNISLGYTLPKKITKKYVQSVRLYVALKNVFTITPYKGYDPEYDVYSYPSVSGCTFGIDIKF